VRHRERPHFEIADRDAVVAVEAVDAVHPAKRSPKSRAAERDHTGIRLRGERRTPRRGRVLVREKIA